MYGVAGERDLAERELDWLAGYAGSRPVRVGNAASRQTQLDIYGETRRRDGACPPWRPGSAAAPRRTAHRLPGASGKDLAAARLRHLGNSRRAPHFVHSKVMAWVAFDRAARAPATAKAAARPLEEDRRRDPRRYLHQGGRCRTRLLCPGLRIDPDGCVAADAAHRRLPAADRQAHQGHGGGRSKNICWSDGLLLRYETASGVDGLPPGEGLFLPCSFWLVDIYLLMGRRREAVRLFERLLKCRNDVGLLAEEYDPQRAPPAG